MKAQSRSGRYEITADFGFHLRAKIMRVIKNKLLKKKGGWGKKKLERDEQKGAVIRGDSN